MKEQPLPPPQSHKPASPRPVPRVPSTDAKPLADFRPAPVRRRRYRKNDSQMWLRLGIVVVFGAIGIGLAIWIIDSVQNAPAPGSSKSNWVPSIVPTRPSRRTRLIEAAQEAVRGKLKAPLTAVFPADNDAYTIRQLPDYTVGVSGYVDASNSFGAMLRSKWVVTLRERNGRIAVVNVKFL